MATVRELDDRERDIARAYGRGADLLVIAQTRGESRVRVRQVLDLFNLNRTAAREAAVSGRVTVRGEQPEPDPRRRRTDIPQRPMPAVPAATATAATVTVPVPVPMPAAELVERLVAEYRAYRCDPCHWTGPAGEHHHPTHPVIVRIIDPAGAR
jgi:hypothetical protein